MASETISDRTRLAALTMTQAKRSAISQLLTSPLYRWRFGGPSASHLILFPQDIRTADPSFAAEIHHGHFGLAGAVAFTNGASPFAFEPPNQVWLEELYGFSWLRHLHASEDDLSREHARRLFRDWVKFEKRQRDVSWAPQIIARRLISWLSHAALLLDGGEDAFDDEVLQSLTRQIRHLAGAYGETQDGLPRLTALIALVLSGLCVAEQEVLIDTYSQQLCTELDRQIFEDGGHISRNPAVLVELLLDLFPLRQCFAPRDREAPQPLVKAINRILPMIRFMRLGDGSLGRFNGMASTLPDSIATVLAQDENQTGTKGLAAQSRYCRLEEKDTVILMDCGGPPPLPLSSKAHAGCLSFEMSSGTSPIIVNCGAPGPADQEWRVTSRATATHSTLTMSNVSSARLLRNKYLERSLGASLLSGPDKIDVKIEPHADAVKVLVAHDGYMDRFGVTHLRQLKLFTSGAILEGIDRLIPEAARAKKFRRHDLKFAVHFHIHPDVQATRDATGGCAILNLPNGELWRFEAEGAVLVLEESLFLANFRGPRRTIKIVLRGLFRDEANVRWRLTKQQT